MLEGKVRRESERWNSVMPVGLEGGGEVTGQGGSGPGEWKRQGDGFTPGASREGGGPADASALAQ